MALWEIWEAEIELEAIKGDEIGEMERELFIKKRGAEMERESWLLAEERPGPKKVFSRSLEERERSRI